MCNSFAWCVLHLKIKQKAFTFCLWYTGKNTTIICNYDLSTGFTTMIDSITTKIFHQSICSQPKYFWTSSSVHFVGEHGKPHLRKNKGKGRIWDKSWLYLFCFLLQNATIYILLGTSFCDKHFHLIRRSVIYHNVSHNCFILDETIWPLLSIYSVGIIRYGFPKVRCISNEASVGFRKDGSRVILEQCKFLPILSENQSCKQLCLQPAKVYKMLQAKRSFQKLHFELN